MTNLIVSAVEAEIAVLKEVRGILTGNHAGHKHGRPAGKKRSTMSAEGRASIAAAQRLRWAKQKAAAKKEK